MKILDIGHHWIDYEKRQSSQPKVVTIFETRSEAVKLFPVIAASPSVVLQNVSCVAVQHRQMLDQVLYIADTRGIWSD